MSSTSVSSNFNSVGAMGTMGAMGALAASRASRGAKRVRCQKSIVYAQKDVTESGLVQLVASVQDKMGNDWNCEWIWYRDTSTFNSEFRVTGGNSRNIWTRRCCCCHHLSSVRICCPRDRMTSESCKALLRSFGERVSWKVHWGGWPAWQQASCWPKAWPCNQHMPEMQLTTRTSWSLWTWLEIGLNFWYSDVFFYTPKQSRTIQYSIFSIRYSDMIYYDIFR